MRQYHSNIEPNARPAVRQHPYETKADRKPIDDPTLTPEVCRLMRQRCGAHKRTVVSAPRYATIQIPIEKGADRPDDGWKIPSFGAALDRSPIRVRLDAPGQQKQVHNVLIGRHAAGRIAVQVHSSADVGNSRRYGPGGPASHIGWRGRTPDVLYRCISVAVAV